MSPVAPRPQVDARQEPGLHFRRATGRIAAPVAVITGIADSQRFGLTVATLTPASDSPPVLMFLASEASRSGNSVLESGRFGVNVLARGQEDLCYRFASSEPDKFAGSPVSEFPSGLPLLEGCTFNADCTVAAVHPMGDHVAIFGSVSWYRAATDSTAPLVFYRSRLAYLDAASGRHVPTESLHWW